jgi:3-mercaptopyruvate sulfurtransferase SseA
VVLSGSDPTPAYRVAVILTYMRVKDVRVLNGEDPFRRLDYEHLFGIE